MIIQNEFCNGEPCTSCVFIRHSYIQYTLKQVIKLWKLIEAYYRHPNTSSVHDTHTHAHAGGNLSSIIAHNRQEGSKFTEGELKRLTRHVALVTRAPHLSTVHPHMDIMICLWHFVFYTF